MPWLRERGVRHVDALVLTHGDEDHAGGAADVLRGFDVGALWLPIGFARDSRLATIADVAQSRGIPVRSLSAGDRGSLDGLAWSVWHPSVDDLNRPSNQRSVTLRIAGQGTSAWIPGDLEAGGERALLGRHPPTVDLLVLGHHGSRKASSRQLLDRLRPTRAWASCGRRNRFGHPAADVRTRLHEHGIALERTDRDGTLSWSF